MADREARDMAATAPSHISCSPGEINALGRLAAALSRMGGDECEQSFGARIREIGRQAEDVQMTAAALLQAGDALSAIEEALTFAFETAGEASSARTLPDAVRSELQKQIDLAINIVDGQALHASFGGNRLLEGGVSFEACGRRLELPRVRTDALGSLDVCDGMLPWTPQRPLSSVEYSQSVASAATGGPNSLECWAEGARKVFDQAVAQVRCMRWDLEEFYSGCVLPLAKTVAVSVSNVLASAQGGADLDEIAVLLAEVRAQLSRKASHGRSRIAGDSVLRLLD